MSGRFIPPFQNKPLNAQILLFTGISIISFSLLSILGPFLLKYFFNISSYDLAGILDKPESEQNINALKFLQFIQAFGLFILPPFLMAFLSDSKPLNWLGFNRFRSTLPVLFFAAVFMVVAQPFINWLADANQMLPVSDWMIDAEKQTEKLTRAFLKMDGISDLMVNLFLVGLLPGIGEELFFRGVMQPLFYRLSGNHHLAIWSTAFIFSAMHMQFLGFIPRFLLGVSLGYIRYWTNSLWASVLAHTVNNSLAVLIYYWVQHRFLSPHAENIGSVEGDLIWVLASALLTLFSLSMIQGWSVVKEEIKPGN